MQKCLHACWEGGGSYFWSLSFHSLPDMVHCRCSEAQALCTEQKCFEQRCRMLNQIRTSAGMPAGVCHTCHAVHYAAERCCLTWVRAGKLGRGLAGRPHAMIGWHSELRYHNKMHTNADKVACLLEAGLLLGPAFLQLDSQRASQAN